MVWCRQSKTAQPCVNGPKCGWTLGPTGKYDNPSVVPCALAPGRLPEPELLAAGNKPLGSVKNGVLEINVPPVGSMETLAGRTAGHHPSHSRTRVHDSVQQALAWTSSVLLLNTPVTTHEMITATGLFFLDARSVLHI